MAKLCKAGIQLREQIDDEFPNRDRRSDGWIADARHLANSSNSDHIPRGGIVRGLDIDANLNDHPEATYALVEQIRKCAKRGDKRIKYIIYDGKIMSPILNWKRRKYKGANPHRSHFHISFTTLGDEDNRWFDLTGERHNAKRSKKGNRKLGESISSSSPSDLPIGGSRPGDDSQCCYCRCASQRNQLA
jgi:hypothetical protein